MTSTSGGDPGLLALTRAARRVATAVLDELAGDLGDRRYDELQILGGELRGAIGDVVRAVRVAPEPLAATAVCTEVLDLARAVIAEAQADPGALAALDVEPDVEDLVTLCARLKVADRLREVGVRDTAAAAGLTAGYISELRAVKKGLPSEDAAMRLDEQVPVPAGAEPLLELVRDAKGEVTDLRKQRRSRRGGTPIAGVATPIPHDLRAKDRLDAVAEALRKDEAILRTVEGLVGLTSREQRAVSRLVAELSGG